jgi:hypothetical protein
MAGLHERKICHRPGAQGSPSLASKPPELLEQAVLRSWHRPCFKWPGADGVRLRLDRGMTLVSELTTAELGLGPEQWLSHK